MHFFSFLVCLTFLCSPALAADVAEETSVEAVSTGNAAMEEVEAALAARRDLAFESFIGLEVIGQAVQARDAELLTDVAVLLQHAEEVLGRPHNFINLREVTSLALQSAANSGDKASMTRLADLAAKLNDEDLKQAVSDAEKLAGAERRLSVGPGLRPADVSAEAIALYNTLLEEVQAAESMFDLSDLEDLRDTVTRVPILHPKQRAHLLALVAGGIQVAKQNQPGDVALLASASRSSGEIRLLSGPKEFRPGTGPDHGTFVVLMTRPAPKDRTVYFSVLSTGPGARPASRPVSPVVVKAGQVSATVQLPLSASNPLDANRPAKVVISAARDKQLKSGVVRHSVLVYPANRSPARQ